MLFFFFFFNDTATTEIYPLSLHDALPIFAVRALADVPVRIERGAARREIGDRGVDEMRRRHGEAGGRSDRKSTRLNSSHSQISYAVFCLKKKELQHGYYPDDCSQICTVIC